MDMSENVEKKPSVIMRANKLSALTQKTFFVVFCLVYSVILFSVIFLNSRYKISGITVIPSILFFMAAILLAAFISNKYANFFERQFYLILFLVVGIMLAINLMLGFLLRYEPVFDLGAIYTGAIEWAETGSFMDNMNKTCDPNYFYYFPNNLGGLTLLFIAFKTAFWVGITDYFAVAVLINGLLSATAVLLTALISKKLFSARAGIVALAFFVLSPPWYLMAPVFYTDSLSVVFPVLSFYLYLKFDESTDLRRRMLFAALTGSAIAIGMLIKFTVLIVLIAIVIYSLLNRRLKNTGLLLVCCTPVMLIISLCFNEYFFANHLDRDRAAELNTPYTHWIMMSLKGSGGYNSADYEFTHSFSDPNERKKAILTEILSRVDEMGANGLLGLYRNKAVAAFGDGTYSQSDFLDDSPVNKTVLHDVVLYGGKYFTAYKYVCCGAFFCLQAFMLAGLCIYTFSKRRRLICVIPQLCVFGIMLFLINWETSGRYITNFVPMIIISASAGIDAAKDIFTRLFEV